MKSYLSKNNNILLLVATKESQRAKELKGKNVTRLKKASKAIF